MSEPVIGNLPPYTWSSEESVAYEAAIEAINGVVGAYSGLITEAEERGSTDEVADLSRRRAACQQERRGLKADNTEEIARVRATYATRLRELTGNDA
ncbi:hypothetical protein OG471_00800 [Streptomyces sp. NBC_01336]|uniref:hypothetical protein n=1 Tax=Streptomyces sp. NBC_01336 TaxID=2903829 RepID=UPI002E120B4C|nr:hypothetical protein OG471_00800 [Streptomyces sp. NBC_01336]